MARGTTPTEPKAERGSAAAQPGADWSRGPVAGAIALVLLLAAAALLPRAMRLGQTEAPTLAAAPVIAPTTTSIHATPEPAAETAPPTAQPAPPTAPMPQPIVQETTEPAESPEATPKPSPEPVTAPKLEPEPEPEPEPQPAGLLIDLNTAGGEELQLLPGIGPAMAARILEDRAANGPFNSIEDLDRVRGIGPRTIDNLRAMVTLSGTTTTGNPQPTADTPTPRLPINTATADELQQLPGIGPALAARIIEDRQANGPFRTIDDLQRVRGIGPKTVERLRPLITARIPTDRQ